MRKTPIIVWILQGVLGTICGIRWLSKRIMYIGTTRYVNNEHLRAATKWLIHSIGQTMYLIHQGIEKLRTEENSAYKHLTDAYQNLKKIIAIIGSDVPNWSGNESKRPLVDSLTNVFKLLENIVQTKTQEPDAISSLKEQTNIIILTLDAYAFHLPLPQLTHTVLEAFPGFMHIGSFVLPNPYFVTFPMLQRKMKYLSDIDTLQLQTPDGASIRVFVFHPAKLNANNTKFVLLASPNACIAECSYSLREAQVRFYTEHGYYVAVYNYRGCGDSTGDVTPDNTVSDGQRVLEMMQADYHTSLHIVHGTSIGGYVVAGLSEQCEISIYDRNFGSMNKMVECMSVAAPLPTLVRLFRRWPMHVISSVNIHKPTVLVFDPHDEIVHFPASLFIGLTDKYYERDASSQHVEDIIRKYYEEFLSALNVFLKEQGWDISGITTTQEINEWMDEVASEGKIFAKWLHVEILGIPLIDVIIEDLKSLSMTGMDRLLKIITVWRQRVTTISLSPSVEEVLADGTPYGECEENNCPYEMETVCIRFLRELNTLCLRKNTIIPDTFSVIAIHTGHNSELSKEAWCVIEKVLEGRMSNPCGCDK